MNEAQCRQQDSKTTEGGLREAPGCVDSVGFITRKSALVIYMKWAGSLDWIALS
jgi:hypothetical protein